MNDYFVSRFITLCNLMVSAIICLVTYILGYHNWELDFHICSGKSPTENILLTITHFSFAKNNSGLNTKKFNLVNWDYFLLLK